MPVNGYTENLENNTKLLKDFVQEKDSGLKGISTYSKSRLFYSNKGRTWVSHGFLKLCLYWSHKLLQILKVKVSPWVINNCSQHPGWNVLLWKWMRTKQQRMTQHSLIYWNNVKKTKWMQRLSRKHQFYEKLSDICLSHPNPEIPGPSGDWPSGSLSSGRRPAPTHVGLRLLRCPATSRRLNPFNFY